LQPFLNKHPTAVYLEIPLKLVEDTVEMKRHNGQWFKLYHFQPERRRTKGKKLPTGYFVGTLADKNGIVKPSDYFW
jgi:hypothetical protein